MKPSEELLEKVVSRINRKLDAWKLKTFGELAALPESVADGEDVIDGRKVLFSVNCWHRDPESVILVVRASFQSGWIVGHDYELGFVMSRHGEFRTATEEEVRSLW